MDKLKLEQAIVVEGRDDVDAVAKACDTLLIPTHGFGIRQETWALIEKAYEERGIVILTDPDFSGEEIRRKLTARFPEAVQAYVALDDATEAGDIGIENAVPEVIRAAVEKALQRSTRAAVTADAEPVEISQLSMNDLIQLGLSGSPESHDLRRELCERLGIGYSNSKSLIKKLNYWRIGFKELEQAIKEITEK